MTDRTNSKPIGGFFELHEPDGASGDGAVLQAWTGGRRYAAFVNARSAFAALVAQFPAATIWLPAFLCKVMLQGTPAGAVRFYPVNDGFQPDIDFVDGEAKQGDVVLIPAYFGLPASPEIRGFATRRRDLRLVEDCAQALESGSAMWSDWRLYSPRKLMGVADGGILVARDEDAPLPSPKKHAPAVDLWAAPLLRYEDSEANENEAWHAANRAKEGAMASALEAMTRLSLSLLSRTSLRSLAAPRLENWRRLDDRLRRWSALPANLASPPLGYIIRVNADLRDKVLAGLHADRIFAAVHWTDIAGPAEDFPREQRWARELITLPCDHRYGKAEMDIVGARAAELLQ
jgi:dTDP-4-amino-4,6-dideoxygalactose transaminase